MVPLEVLVQNNVLGEENRKILLLLSVKNTLYRTKHTVVALPGLENNFA